MRRRRFLLTTLLGLFVLSVCGVLGACGSNETDDPREILRRRNALRTVDKPEPLPKVDPPEARVRLTRPFEKSTKAEVRVAGAWTLVDLRGRVIGQGNAMRDQLTLGPTGALLGVRVLPTDGAVLRPAAEGDLRVGGTRYPGTLRIARSLDGRTHAYVVTDLETYLQGVVPGEIPATFPREAQRVQAIIARTYAMSAVPDAARGAPIVVTDSGRHDQEYHGIPPVPSHRRIAKDAVESTAGLVALDGAEPLRAWYHSTCGGHTTPAADVFRVPGRVALSGVGCSWCTASKYYRWSSDVAAVDVVKAAGLSGELTAMQVARRDSAGRATAFRIRTTKSDKVVRAPEFRLRLGPSKLRSTWIDESSVRGAAVHLAGRGWGHGVGLCQMGAKGLAEKGMRGEDIVTTYYPGVRVARIW